MRVPMRSTGADHPVIVMKSLQWRWIEGDEPARSKRWSTGKLGGTGILWRILGTMRSQEESWQEPCESRGSRTDLWERGGEVPPRHPTNRLAMKMLTTTSWLSSKRLWSHTTVSYSQGNVKY